MEWRRWVGCGFGGVRNAIQGMTEPGVFYSLLAVTFVMQMWDHRFYWIGKAFDAFVAYKLSR